MVFRSSSIPCLFHEIRFLILTTLCLQIVLCFDEVSRLDPTRVNVVTVIDNSNEEVLRDALTLIRSIRLFGGLLNKATVTAFIPIDDENCFFENSNHGLLKQIALLGAEVFFFPQAIRDSAKTMNKFEAMKHFDLFRFDYLLWLDADIVVFGDPIKDGALRKHHFPGRIDCVPDFYSYLRRFPHVNTTSHVWSTSLPTWHLLGHSEIAPHGTCNTGVLFFDSTSLQKFMAILPSVVDIIDNLNPYKKDRFLDSLYFVAAVNTADIYVNTLDYNLNYMAFFEHEIQREEKSEIKSKIKNDILFAHFLANTTMYCKMEHVTTISSKIGNSIQDRKNEFDMHHTYYDDSDYISNYDSDNHDNFNYKKVLENGKKHKKYDDTEIIAANFICSCNYLTIFPIDEKKSKIVDKIKLLLPSPICQMMAGFEPVPIPEQLKIQKIQNRSTEFSCKIKSVDDKNNNKNDDDEINNNSNCNNSYDDNDNNISNDNNNNNNNNDDINNNNNNNNSNNNNNNNNKNNNDNNNNDNNNNNNDNNNNNKNNYDNNKDNNDNN